MAKFTDAKLDQIITTEIRIPQAYLNMLRLRDAIRDIIRSVNFSQYEQLQAKPIGTRPTDLEDRRLELEIWLSLYVAEPVVTFLEFGIIYSDDDHADRCSHISELMYEWLAE